MKGGSRIFTRRLPPNQRTSISQYATVLVGGGGGKRAELRRSNQSLKKETGSSTPVPLDRTQKRPRDMARKAWAGIPLSERGQGPEIY